MRSSALGGPVFLVLPCAGMEAEETSPLCGVRTARKWR